MNSFAFAVAIILQVVCSQPVIPNQFTASTLTVNVNDGQITSKVKAMVYYDGPTNRSRVDSVDLLWNSNSTAIFRGDLQQEILIREDPVPMCVIISAPSVLPEKLVIPPEAKFIGYDTVNNIQVSVYQVSTDLDENSTYYLKDESTPVRIITGTSKQYSQVDYLDFQLGRIDPAIFLPPRHHNCTHAYYPGTSRLMDRVQLEDYFTVKPISIGGDHRANEIQFDQVKLGHNKASRAVDPATVIMIGKEIWKVIEDNKPSLAVQTLSNGVIPANTTFFDMEGWKMWTWKPFGWSWKNLYGIEVVNFEWSFDWNCDGSYNGVGHYLQNAGPFPKSISVGWGYTVNVDAQMLVPANIGTKADPVAAATFELTMKISTVLKTSTQSCKVNLQGDCNSSMSFCDQYDD